MKIILNKTFGGFGVSYRGYELYAKKKGIDLYIYEDSYDFKNPRYTRIDDGSWKEFSMHYFTKDFGKVAQISDEDFNEYCLYLNSDCRTDPVLIEVVEELNKGVNSNFADLRVVEIPDGSYYVIDEYDGYETLYWSKAEIKEI